MAKAKAASKPDKTGKVAPLTGSYDLVLKGGRVIDPAQGLDGLYDIAIRKGKIAALAPAIAADRKTKTLDMRGRVVTPGRTRSRSVYWGIASASTGTNSGRSGRGPTRLISPFRTLSSWGSSSTWVVRRTAQLEDSHLSPPPVHSPR